jgi:hypothetical protein
MTLAEFGYSLVFFLYSIFKMIWRLNILALMKAITETRRAH